MRLSLLLLLVLLPPAVAEAGRVVAVIEDPTGDVTFARAAVWMATPETDVARVTFRLDDEAVLVRIDVVDLAHRTRPDETISFDLYWRTEGYSFAAVWAQWLPPTYGAAAGPHFNLLLHAEDGGCVTCGGAVPELDGEWDAAGGSVSYRIPRAFFTSDLEDPWLVSMVYLPTSTNSVTGAVALGDLAPDHGYGPSVPTR